MGDTERAEALTRDQAETAKRHEGNRAGADMDAPQPTREPTRDQDDPAEESSGS